MTDLASKYRPRRFAEVVGQDDTVSWLQGEVSAGRFRSVVMSGPFGTGKTSLGMIYAKASLCAAPDRGEPCGACEHCLRVGHDGKGFIDLTRFECGETSTVDDVTHLLELAKSVPFFCDRRVIIMDEAHNLSRRAFEALLKAWERPPERTTFIVLTSKPDVLPAALLSRLTHLRLTLLGPADAQAYLADICAEEGIRFSNSGLALIHSAVGGHPRALLRAAEKAAAYGDLSEVNVRRALNLDFLDRFDAYVSGLLAADLQRQVACIDTWPDAASQKLEYLHRFFVFVYFNRIRRVEREDAVLRGVSDGLVKPLVECMATRAEAVGLDVDVFWEKAIAVLAPRERVSDHTLALILSHFDRLVNGLRTGSIPAMQQSAGRSRRLRVASIGVPAPQCGEYSSWKTVRPIWDAASFMTQHHGALFNLRATFRLPVSGSETHEYGSRIVSAFTHEMGERLRDWNGDGTAVLHWIYRHRADANGAFVSGVALAVPTEYLPAIRRWAHHKFAPRRRRAFPQLEFSLAFRESASAAARVRFHWRTVRALSRDLDPALYERSEDGARRALVDLLGIPERWRSPASAPRCARTRGVSETLGPKMQMAVSQSLPLLSAIRDRAWTCLDSGWELLEHVDRRNEMDRRLQGQRRVFSQFPGDDELSEARRAAALAELENYVRQDPHSRLRSWEGWWSRSSRKTAKRGHFSKGEPSLS